MGKSRLGGWHGCARMDAGRGLAPTSSSGSIPLAARRDPEASESASLALSSAWKKKIGIHAFQFGGISS